MAKKIRRRMAELAAAKTLADMGPPKTPPARCHELTGGKRGRQCQLSVDLTDIQRLIFVPAHNPERKNLRKLLTANAILSKEYGSMVKKIRRRMAELAAAKTLADMGPPKTPPARCHELTGGKRGRQCQLSVDLTDIQRLIFVPAHNPIPRKPDGGLDWKQADTIEILGVENTHGK